MIYNKICFLSIIHVSISFLASENSNLVPMKETGNCCLKPESASGRYFMEVIRCRYQRANCIPVTMILRPIPIHYRDQSFLHCRPIPIVYRDQFYIFFLFRTIPDTVSGLGFSVCYLLLSFHSKFR